MVFGVKHDADSNLPKIAQAMRKLGMFFGPRKHREEKTYQYGDDRDNDQKFDEGESSSDGGAAHFRSEPQQRKCQTAHWLVFHSAFSFEIVAR